MGFHMIETLSGLDLRTETRLMDLRVFGVKRVYILYLNVWMDGVFDGWRI